MHIRIQNSRILFQQLQVHSSIVSSNRIKIQEILLILQLETGYSSKLFISEIHSKQWHYSLHRDFQNCYSTRRSPTGFFSSNSSSNATRAHYTAVHPENSPSRIQFYMQKTKSSSSTTTTFQRAKKPSFQKRNSTHRRQGDLLEIHPCVLQDIPGNSSCSRDIPDIPVIHDLPAFPGNSTMFQYLQGIHPIPAFSD